MLIKKCIFYFVIKIIFCKIDGIYKWICYPTTMVLLLMLNCLNLLTLECLDHCHLTNYLQGLAFLEVNQALGNSLNFYIKQTSVLI